MPSRLKVQPGPKPRPSYGRGFIALENSRHLEGQKERHQILSLTASGDIATGEEITISGGTTVEAANGMYAPLEYEPGTIITPYKLVINGAEGENWTDSPAILPEIAPGDTIQAKDAFGRLSNIITAPAP